MSEHDPTIPAPPLSPSVQIVDTGERVPPTLEGIAGALDRIYTATADLRSRVVALEDSLPAVTRDSQISHEQAERWATTVNQIHQVLGNVQMRLDRDDEHHAKINGLTGCLALLVEDERMQRQIVAEVLRSRGALVIECETATAALEILNQVDPCIAVIDLSLSRENEGLDLAKVVRQRKRRAGIVMTSGYFDEHGRHDNPIVNQDMADLAAIVLPKPQSVAALVASALRARAWHEEQASPR